VRGALLVAACATALPLRAQTPTAIPDVAVGTRIRVESPAVFPKVAVGHLRDANQGYVTVTLAPRSFIQIPWSQVSSLAYVAGRSEHVGAATGAVLGAALSLVAYPASIVVVPAGAATVGWMLGPQRWQSVSWRPGTDTVMLDGEAPRLHLAPDAQVLVRVRRAPMRGRVVAATADSLEVRLKSGLLQLPWSDVSDLRVRGRRNRLKGAAMGISLVGVATAARLAFDTRTGTSVRGGVVLGGLLIGGGTGALIGAPGWVRIPFPAR
jgi:hypothetical protein